jgi:hypothetical protein
MITEILWLLTWPILIAVSLVAIIQILKKYDQRSETKKS